MSAADRLAEAADLWTGYECLAGTWFAMYCNVDMDQTERANRPEVVWVRNSAAVVTAPPVDIERCARAAHDANAIESGWLVGKTRADLDTAWAADGKTRAMWRDAARAVLREAGVIERGDE